DRLGIEDLARLRVWSGDEPAEEVVLLPEGARVRPRTDESVGGPEQLVVPPAVALLLRAACTTGERGEVGSRLGHAEDALLRTLGHGLCERMRVGAGASVEQAEVVTTGTATGDFERVLLHPRAGIDRLVVGQLLPACDEVLCLRLHQRKLRPLVLRGVPGQHHAADALVFLAVADPRDAPASAVLQLVEEVDLLDALAELL